MMKYLVLIADIDEFNPMTDGLKEKGIALTFAKTPVGNSCNFIYKGSDVTALCFGIGKVNAATGAAYMLARESYDGVINTGWSGAISNVIKGDILVADSCVECDFDFTKLGKPLGEKPCQETYIYKCDSDLADKVRKIEKFTHGKLGTGDIFLSDPVKAKEYKDIFDINAFDMESGALASVCHILSVPFVSIRKISDNANDSAPEDYRDILFSDMEAFSDILVDVLDALQ